MTLTNVIESNKIYKQPVATKGYKVADEFFAREKESYIKAGMDEKTFRTMWNIANSMR